MLCDLIPGDCRELIAPVLSTPSPTNGTCQYVNCIIADPPYGIGFKSFKAETPAGRQWVNPIQGDDDLDGAIELFLEAHAALEPFTAPDCEMYVFTAWNVVDAWVSALRTLAPSWKYQMLLVWSKGYPGLGDLDGNWPCGHELILYMKKGRRQRTQGRSGSGIIHADKLPANKNIHPTEKPVALIERLIEFSTDPGDLVVDPFAGSASTLVAARTLGRNVIGFEKDVLFYQRAKERIAHQGFTF